MNHRSLVGTLGVVLALASLTHAADEYEIKLGLGKGSKLQVEEHVTSTSQILWKARNAKVGGAEEKVTAHRYVQEIRSKQPLVHWREYAESTRSKHKPKERPTPINTSLHKQRILVYGLEMKPDGAFEIAKEDGEALRLDRLPAALLPARRLVKVRESWNVSSDRLAAALFPPSIANTSRKSSGKVTLRSVKSVKGATIATLKVKISLIVERTSTFPGIDMALKGEVKWNLDEGACVEAGLSGPLKYVMGTQDPDNPGVVESDGMVSWSYKAEILEARGAHGKDARKAGSPPPPGTAALQCELNPEHKIDLRWQVRCPLCGKALDKDRSCPNGDPFVFQFCPHDGAPLHPVQ